MWQQSSGQPVFPSASSFSDTDNKVSRSCCLFLVQATWHLTSADLSKLEEILSILVIASMPCIYLGIGKHRIAIT